MENFTNETIAAVGIGGYIALQLFSNVLEKIYENRSSRRAGHDCVSSDEFHQLRRKLENHIAHCRINTEIERQLREQNRNG